MTMIHGAGGGGGTRRSAPKVKEPPKPVIAQDDPALKSISFAKLQFLLCEGEIEGPAEGNTTEGLERSVLLDDTPVRIGSTVAPQPEDLVFSYGRDHSDQSGVPDYNRVTSVESVDTLCTQGSPVTQSLSPSVAGGTYYARVLLTWSQLLVSIVDGDGAPISGPTGSIKSYTVNYTVSYTDSGGTSRTAFNGDVQGKFSSTFQRTHEFLLQGTGPWVVSVVRNTADDADAFGGDNRVAASSEFNFSSVALSLDQKFSFANSSVLSVGVRADNYSEIPNVAIDLKGLRVQIPTNATVAADGSLTYTGTWDGTWQTAWCSDPAWCLRDLIINKRYGSGEFIDETFVDKWSLYEISKYCNEQVPAPGGGTEPRFSCNLLLQSSGEAWQVLQQLSSIFRGMVYYASSIAVAAQDKEKDAIFTFNESNTIEEFSEDGKVSQGNFTYSGTARRARHTVCLASWDDPQDNFETRIEYVTDEESFSELGYRPIDLRLFGVTSRGQALRAANWTLLSEQLLSDTVAFKTNELGMAMRPGDIVKIADPVKAAVRAGGRITGVVGNTIELDYIPASPPSPLIGSTLSWMYNEPVTATDGPNQPRLYTAKIIDVPGSSPGPDWENGQGICVDQNIGDYNESDIDTLISGRFVSLCIDPTDDIFDPGTDLYDNADAQPRDAIIVDGGGGGSVIIDGNGGHPPEENNPFLIEFAARSAQQFRVLTVTQEEEGVYAITGLRYREDIYDAVDFDTPLQRDPNYLFRSVVPGQPQNVIAQVVWDNNQAKIDIRWDPPANSTILFEYDLTVRDYRVQWQAGSVEGGVVTWSGAWRELPRQTDDREMVPIEELSITDRFRVRIAAVGRLGIQSQWSDIVVADDITTWFPMPDITGAGILDFQNQSTGGQLFIWDFSSVRVPPYVNGVRLDVLPNRPLTPREALGLKPPDSDGRYIYGDFPLEEYAVAIFHADTNWVCRVSFLTAVLGLKGDSYASATVTRNDLVPPPPDRFTVVTETDNKSLAPLRRFSWTLPTSEIDDTRAAIVPFDAVGVLPMIVTPNWPLGKVTDIDQFYVRYKAGFQNNWDLGVPLFADGVPGDQRFFETELFDGGTWTVMIRSVDRTGWVSDNQASIIINLGDAIPTNVVETFEAHTDGWPGQKVNMEVVGGALQQIDPTIDGFYSYAFEVTTDTEDSGPVITTDATGTYQWFIRGLGADIDARMYPDPQGDPMYPDPQTDYVYLDTNNTIGDEFHPYVPFEKLAAGNYEIACLIRSVDGTTPTALNEVTVRLDYPDVRQTMEDVAVDDTGNQTITFPEPFPHKCKAVSITLQDPPGTVTVPATAYIRGKTVDNFRIRLLDANGNIISGLVDVTAVGY